jgi:hypothetical protein
MVRAGLFGDGADGRTALADDVADLLRMDLELDDARGVLGHLGAMGSMTLFISPRMCRRPSAPAQGLLHDLAGDAVDLDVHLQGVDAVGGAGDLEVHVAEVVLVAQDVGQHREARRLP